jgi:hypothetical protein
MIGLGLFSGLAHESEEVGRRFQDSHAADLATRICGKTSGIPVEKEWPGIT